MRRGDLMAGLFVAAFFALWYAPAVLGGQVCTGEDVVGHFFASRSELYGIAHGRGFSWWDPLPGLGMPRLGNIQGGVLSPCSLLFYLFPTVLVFRFYPALILAVTTLLTYALFRTRQLAPVPALAGALSWTTLGIVMDHTQHPPVVETLAWLPAALLCWERYRRDGRAGSLGLGAVAMAFQSCGGSPQYILYDGMVMVAWIGIDLVRRFRRRDLAAALGMLAAGALLAAWPLLPFWEMAARSHRGWLSAKSFADTFRASPSEIALSLAEEALWLMNGPPLMRYGAPYHNLPGMSALVPVLAGLAVWRRPGRLAEAAVAAIFLLGMLGSGGPVLPVLKRVVPLASELRAPVRMLVPAGFFLAWLAAAGLQEAETAGRPSRRLTWLALIWIVLANASVKLGLQRYDSPQAFVVPPAIASARPRLTVDIFGSAPDMSPFAVDAGIVAGVPTLMMRETLWPRDYFEALFACQYGPLDGSPGQQRKVDLLIANNAFPVRYPSRPLMRAFGLRTLVRYRGGGRWERRALPGVAPRFFVATRFRVAATPAQRWAAAAALDWDPHRDAILSVPGPPVVAGVPSRVTVLEDAARRQVLEVASGGGVLVTSELMWPGWSVTVDGRPAAPLEVDLALRGVALPPGRHRVEWRYRPPWLGAALACTVAAAGLLALLLRLLNSSRRTEGGTKTL